MAELENGGAADTVEDTPEVSQETQEETLTFSDDAEENGGDDSIPDNPKKRKRKKKLIILGIIALVIIGLVVADVISSKIKEAEEKKNMYTDIAVERRTIKKSITGSSSIEPNDSYDVMTMKSGDITADYFKEGDTVKKGDKLYQFDDEEARDSLETAQNAVTKAQQAYIDAVKQRSSTIDSNNIATQSTQNAVNRALNSLNDAQSSYDDQYVETNIGGKVTNVTVKEGDTVATGTQIATIYDDSKMKLRIPFNDYDAENIAVGDSAEVTVTASGDTLYGTVTEKASAPVSTAAHNMLVYATIEVANPGALTTDDRGSAVVNGAACADSVNFEYIDTQTLTAKSMGTLESLNVAEGDKVYAGEQLAYIKSDTVTTALDNAKLSYDDAVLNLQKQVIQNDTYSQDSAIKSAQLALDDAKTNLKKAEDAVEDFVVEAPIEGTVVTKNAKNGDTRDSTNSTEALCVIYDLSSLKISLEVDETEIALVKTGQKATITADAVEGEFEGEVTKVPVDGVNTNGVTTYTVEIQIKDYGALLPGMNVDAEIVVEEADNALTIPVNSINRGNIVFVKDDGTQHTGDVTDAINERRENPDAKTDISDVPASIEIPEGYRAIKIETGLNDNDYIEVKSGLGEGDSVRTLNTKSSSEDADFGMPEGMQGMNGGMRQGGMSGAPGGGGMRQGGAGGGMGGPPGR